MYQRHIHFTLFEDFFGCTWHARAATSVAMSMRRRRADESPSLGSAHKSEMKKNIEKMTATGITTGIAWKKRRRTLQVMQRGNSLDWKREGRDQLVKRVRLREGRESQRDRAAGERAGGMMPRASWQMENSLSQRWGATMLRLSEARRHGWKLNGPRRWQVGSESGTATDQATNLAGSGIRAGERS